MINTVEFIDKCNKICKSLSDKKIYYGLYTTEKEMDIVLDFVLNGDFEYDGLTGELSIKLKKVYQQYDSNRYNWDKRLDEVKRNIVVEFSKYEYHITSSVVKNRMVVIDCKDKINAEVILYITFEKFFSSLLMFLCKVGIIYNIKSSNHIFTCN